MLSLRGDACKLYQDDVLLKEINRGALLVPHSDEKTLMLDRYDCRGHISDLQNYKPQFDKVAVSREELEIERSCEYERYYDLHLCNDFNNDNKIICFEDQVTNNLSSTTFTAGEIKDAQTVQCAENVTKDAEYICPSSLLLPRGMILPSTEREAAIIEQTARSVAEKGAQLEILIKVKQANSKHFGFLNYEHKLYPFYHYITNLIKSAQYIPPKRFISHLVQMKDEISENHISSSNILQQKIDISNTPYGKLIERFKKFQQEKKENKIEEVLQDVLQPCSDISTNLTLNIPSPDSTEIIESRQRMYQELYHQYFPFYFQHCKDMYGHLKPHDILTEMARDYAASFAVAWIQSNMLETALINQKQDEDERVMKKMAEYVAKNGQELELIMHERNKYRFDFLLPNHPNHDKYKKYLNQELLILHPERVKEFELPKQTIDCIVDSYGPYSPPNNNNKGPISFKLVNKNLKSNPYIVHENSQPNDIEEDIDQTMAILE